MNDLMFSKKGGHNEIQKNILSGLKQNRLHHAYLFFGPEGTGKDAFAFRLAQLLNCEQNNFEICDRCSSCKKILAFQHPDVHFIFPTPSETNFKNEEYLELLQEKAANPYLRIGFPEKNTFIGIDKIRELKREAGFKTYEGKRKVYIFGDADHLRPEAANAMLKMLEEPPANLLLILTTSNMNKILPTIRSRCQLIRFSRLSEEQIREIVKIFRPDTNEAELSLIIRLAEYNLKQIFEFLDVDIGGTREHALEYLRKLSLIRRSHELMAIIENMGGQRGRREARQLLWFLLLWFRDILHFKNGIIDSARLTNFDMVDNLSAFISYAPNADVLKIVWDIEGALQDLNDIRNFNPVLILTTLAFKLNRQIRA